MDADYSTQRSSCFFCNRKFALDALERHEKICEKTAQKKRKQFVSAKQRITDGDGAQKVEYVPPPTLKTRKSKPVPPRKSAPRPSTVPARLIAPSNDCVPCPHCDRNFGSKSAERHVKWCGEQKARIPRSPPNNTAKNRLSARIQYKAPPLGKKSPLPRIFTSPKNPHGVSVIGKPIARSSSIFGGAAPSVISPCESISGTSSSSGWEWEEKPLPVASNQKKGNYDPYLAAKLQMQQLRSTVQPRCGTSPTDCDPSTDAKTQDGGKDKDFRRKRADRAIQQQQQLQSSKQDDNNNRCSNVSQDSDYGSLFIQRSPNSKSRTPSPTRLFSLSPSQCLEMEYLMGCTSGSESSLPSVVSPVPSSGPVAKLPKFCHECGSQYPVQSAKFCCECGIRRLFV